ncbi:hypothetical protein J6590_068762 [Homalodisca vitripennis]|nr:hypothetical protein J6590_068762 [Homalodisca vitripennis]
MGLWPSFLPIPYPNSSWRVLPPLRLELPHNSTSTFAYYHLLYSSGGEKPPLEAYIYATMGLERGSAQVHWWCQRTPTPITCFGEVTTPALTAGGFPTGRGWTPSN